MKIQKHIITLLLLLTGTTAMFSQQVLTGTVHEIFNNVREPLMGVNINIVNRSDRSIGGTVTGIDGSYRLQIPANEKDLRITFSFISMASQSFNYTGQPTINVTMRPAEKELAGVEVKGRKIDRNDMGISQREAVSATQKVDMEELVANVPVLSVEEALQGRLGGVDIIMGGGDPGARSSIRIRGTSTLNASSEPLIVIDGVAYNTTISEDFDFSTANNEDLGSLLNIAPTDIESVEVLKDAAATAIWGTKGANGVLLITTKKGKSGRTNFSYSSKFTAKQEPRTIPMLNGSQYTALMQDAIWNSANYTGLNNTTSKYLELLYNTNEIGYAPDWKYFDEYNQNTDWLDEIRHTSMSYDNNFSMSGGGDKANYRFSLGYLNEGGTTIGTGLNRLNTSLNINYMFSNKLKIGVDFGYSNIDKKADWAGNLRSEAFKKMPNKSPYWIDDATGERTDQYFSYQTTNFESVFDGKDGKNYNPVAMAKESYNNTTQREEKITFRLDYQLLPELTYKAVVALNMRTTKNRKFLPQIATGVVWTDKFANQSTDALSDAISLQFENKLSYIKRWNSTHQLVATAVLRSSQSQSASYTSTTSGNASSGLSDPIIGAAVEGMNSGESESRSVTGVAMLNYALLERYILHVSATAEGNSAMGDDQRFAYFPVVGLSWNMQNEPFMKNTEKWLDEAKFRVSLGQSGRAPSGASLYLGAFSSAGSYMDMAAIAPIRMQLNDLRWETSTEVNFGIDLSLLRGNLSFTFDWYRKWVKDLLMKDVDIASHTGYANIKYYNSGELGNQGWEFRTDYVILNNKTWRLAAYVNFSRDINEVTKIPENMKQENYTFKNGSYALLVEAGRPLGAFYGYKYEGVYQSKNDTYARDKEGNVMNDVDGKAIIMKNGTAVVCPGDARYTDQNKDGVINEYDIVYLGNYTPVLTGGAGFSIKYKQFTINTFFHGRFGQKIINAARMNNESMYNSNNQSTATLRRWRNEGDDTDIPRALYTEGFNYLGSSRFVEDASYVRLKSISLTFQLPRKISKQLRLNTLNVFVTGYDLYTWTAYRGQDPEVPIPTSATKLAQDNATTPAPIRFSAGFNVNF
ncbi:MAG: SusC/RagA family TonB-linked outer membrane protein [Paludibacter sp.]|jgi:TonB-linked SusC/RagA family outer membrane protein|nr:SusC/RagA family TonB-linked outer membrane protein [Paludibacter sp.]